MSEVVVGVREVGSIVNHISSASAQQADSVSEITLGVDQIASVVQTSSATAEQSAAASEQLSSQAMIMKELMGKFNLSN